MIEVIREAVGNVIYERYGKGVHSAQTVFLITQAIDRELSTEYGACGKDGAHFWFSDKNSVSGKGSRSDAERVIKEYKLLYGEDYFLIQRLVSKGVRLEGEDS